MLFSYYLLLNLGIVAIAWFKAWRVLNLVGFLFTFFIGLAWGVRFYPPELFDTTEPFLIAFFLMYVSWRSSSRGAGAEPGAYVDGMIVFGVPIAAFGLQAGLIRDTEFGLAFLRRRRAVYLALALALRARPAMRLLAESFLALGVVFATLAIPLALDARWTSAAWALEGAAVVWVGMRQERRLARAFGILLQSRGRSRSSTATAGAFGIPLLDPPFVGALLLSIAGLWSYRLLANAGERVSKFEQGLVPFGFAWGLAWWLFAANHEIHACR